MRRPTAILFLGVVAALLAPSGTAAAHGGATEDFRIRVLDVTPRNAAIDVRSDGERLVVENEGDEEFRLCRDDDEPGACTGRRVGPGDTRRIDDARLHWVGGEANLPPGVDAGDPSPQRVFDVELDYRQGPAGGQIRARLEYVGGRSWLQRYGEYALLVAAVLVMLVVFLVDARRRRRAGAGVEEPAADAPGRDE